MPLFGMFYLRRYGINNTGFGLHRSLGVHAPERARSVAAVGNAFGHTGAADECLFSHDDRWGLPQIGSYEPYRRYKTHEDALNYARAVKALAERFLAE